MRNARVHYEKEFDQIIREKVAENPHNKLKGFKEAATIIRKMPGGSQVTAPRLSTRYYTILNPPENRGNTQSSGGIKSTATKVDLFIDLSEELSKEDKLTISKKFVSGLTKEDKLNFIKSFIAELN